MRSLQLLTIVLLLLVPRRSGAIIATPFEAIAERARSVVLARAHAPRRGRPPRFTVLRTIAGRRLTGTLTIKSPENLHFLEFVRGRDYLLALDENGAPVSDGNSCGAINVLEVKDGQVFDAGEPGPAHTQELAALEREIRRRRR